MLVCFKGERARSSSKHVERPVDVYVTIGLCLFSALVGAAIAKFWSQLGCNCVRTPIVHTELDEVDCERSPDLDGPVTAIVEPARNSNNCDKSDVSPLVTAEPSQH